MSELQDPEIFRAVLDSLQAGVYVVDRDGKILFWNRGAERLTGYMRHDVVGRTSRTNILVHCNGQSCMACGTVCPLGPTLHDGRPREALVQLRHREGHPVPVLLRSSPIRDHQGAIIGVAESFDEQRFLANRSRAQDKPIPQGFLDETTGIPNHLSCESQMRDSLASFATDHVPFGVICIQVDNLEHFRNTYGRQANDAILRVVSHALGNSFRPTDFLGRWSEDRFLAILPNCGSMGTQKAVERIQEVVSCAGIEWWGNELSVTTSLGYTIAQTGDTSDSLAERAQRLLDRTSQKPLEASASRQGNPD